MLRAPGLLWLTFVIVAVQPSSMEKSSDLVKHWEPVHNYLTQYGYLLSSPQGADNLQKEDNMREAIRMMQTFGGIPATGVVDENTLALLRKRRCGMSDSNPGERVRRYAVQGQQWEKTNLTWSIKYWPHSLSTDLVRAELRKAFKVWSDVSLLNFQEVKSLNADIVVSFERGQHGDGYAFDGRGVVLAHAFFPGEGIGGDAHFDAEEPWVDRQPSAGIDGVRLFAVAAHEFGHSLGLSHSSVSGALMNPFYQLIEDNFQLPYDDALGIQRLYGSRHPRKWVPLSPYIPPTTHRSHPSRPSGTGSPTKPSRYPTNRPSYPKSPPPTCNTSFDAVTVIRTEIFMFKNNFFWRLNEKGLMKDYPAEIKRFFPADNLEHVDAVYERPLDRKIVFFSGTQYWLFEANIKEAGYPRPLTDLGLPPHLKRIDAAMVWGYNGKTYFFAGKQYWRFDESEGRVELDYPRDMAMWRGVPYHVDAAFQHIDGTTYFFKGNKFWEFNDRLMSVKKSQLKNVNQYWFGCPIETEIEIVPEPDASSSSSHVSINTVAMVTFLLASFFYSLSLQSSTI